MARRSARPVLQNPAIVVHTTLGALADAWWETLDRLPRFYRNRKGLYFGHPGRHTRIKVLGVRITRLW